MRNVILETHLPMKMALLVSPNAQVKNAWSYATTPPYVFMA
jgi:hypothetical protein